MRRTFLVLFILFCVPLISGFQPLTQAASASIIVLNRDDQRVSQMTDGDNIRIQITLSGAAEQTEKINFSLANATLSIGPWAPAVLEPLIVGLKAKGFCFETLRQHPAYRDWIASHP